MSSPVGLPEALERAASALPDDADAIRPANGDPVALARVLDPEAALRVLAWLLENEPPAGEELAAEWAEDPQGAGRVVLEIDLETLPKVARKALRRVRHRLRSRGVELPEAPPSAVVATLPPVGDAIEEARISPLDPRGARVAYVALDHPSGGVRLFEIVLDDVHGVLAFEVYNTGRRRARGFLRELERTGARRAAPAPVASVRALVARAVAAQPKSRPLPRGFSEWRSRLTEVGPDASTPGELARASVSTAQVDEAEALERARQWVEAGSLGPWPPDPERAQSAAEKISEAGKGVLVVSDGTRQEQVERALEAAVEDLFDAEHVERTALRFEESAYVLWKTGQEEDAAIALRVAEVFRSRGIQDNPVPRAMLERLFAPVLAAPGADAEAGGAGSDPASDAVPEAGAES